MKNRTFIKLCKEDCFNNVGDQGCLRHNHNCLHKPSSFAGLGSVRVGAIPVFNLHVAIYNNATQVMYYIRQ